MYSDMHISAHHRRVLQRKRALLPGHDLLHHTGYISIPILMSWAIALAVRDGCRDVRSYNIRQLLRLQAHVGLRCPHVNQALNLRSVSAAPR